MAKQIWEIWIENHKRMKRDFEKFMKSRRIKLEMETKDLVKGHIEKAEHNLKFVSKTRNLREFNDWAIVSAYYAIYHASLALCSLKGYSTKNHLATLLILVKEFYQNGLAREEIELINKTTVGKEEILYYTEAKSKRNKASYSTNHLFNENEVESLQKKAIKFVNKAKEIIEQDTYI